MAQQIQVGEHTIGNEEPSYIIAEAGINHNGSVQTAKNLIDIAAEAEANAVKFQKRSLKETYTDDVVEDPTIAEMGIEYTVSNLKRVTLTDAEFREIASYTRTKEIEFLCSPWDIESVEFIESIDIPAYKIGSPDLTNFVLLERVVKTGKPLMISTGMASQDEIERTIEFLQERDADFALLHCRSTYPAPFHNLNLSYMEKLQETYDVPVGYSGHERGIAVSEAAVAMGATVIERHFTLDRTMEGPDHAASLEPTGLQKLVRDIRHIEESQGTATRYMTRGEYNNRVSLAKSLAVSTAMETGEQLDRADLTAKSPAKGISPQYLYDVVGEEVTRDISADSLLTWEDVSESVGEEYDTDLRNWGVVVRYSDVLDHDWGEPDVFEFRINGADIDADIDGTLSGTSFEKELGVHAPEQKGHNLVDLSSLDETRRKEAVTIIQEVIDLTRDVLNPRFESDAAPKVVVHPGGITTDEMEPDKIPAMNEALKRSLNDIDDEGIDLLLENMPPLPWIYGGQRYHNNFMDAEEIAAFCEETGYSICYDTSHAKLWCNYDGADLKTHAEILEPYTEYLHVADAAGVDGEGIQIGEGEIDFAKLGAVFEEFDRPVITEIWRGHERNGAGFKKAAARLKEHFN